MYFENAKSRGFRKEQFKTREICYLSESVALRLVNRIWGTVECASTAIIDFFQSCEYCSEQQSCVCRPSAALGDPAT